MFGKEYLRCFVSKEEHDEAIKRIEAEQKRTNQRLEILEKLDEKIYQVIGSIEKMSVNVENMLKAQEKQETEKIEASSIEELIAAIKEKLHPEQMSVTQTVEQTESEK